MRKGDARKRDANEKRDAMMTTENKKKINKHNNKRDNINEIRNKRTDSE